LGERDLHSKGSAEPASPFMHGTPFLSSKQLKTARNGKNLKNICKDFYTAKTP
jgi:hypothetical protein